MQPLATPATGILLSPADQKRLTPRQVEQLAALQSAKILPAEDMAALVTRLPRQATGGEMARTELEPWLREVLKPVLVPEPKWYFGDTVYYLPTAQDVQTAWAGSGLGDLISTPQRFDCDDFAFAFKGHCSRFAYFRGDWKLCGLCVGFVSGLLWRQGRHAASLYVGYDNGVADVRLFEPGNGTPHTLAECREISGLFI